MKKYIPNVVYDIRFGFMPFLVENSDFLRTKLRILFAGSALTKEELIKDFVSRFEYRFLTEMDENSAEIERKYGYPDGYIRDKRRDNATEYLKAIDHDRKFRL